jgi:TolB-like protein/Flp pilus assembly protein TadD
MEAGWRFCDAVTGAVRWTYGTVVRLQDQTDMVRSLRPTYRFGEFELDVRGYELRRRGRPIRLERQPMDVLILLVERRRELVTRDDIAARLWGDTVFVDMETGINTAIMKIRRALRDSPNKLRSAAVIETVPGKGYRFVAELLSAPGAAESPTVVAVLPFVNLSPDQESDHLADGLTEDAICTLGQIDPDRIRVIGRISAMTYKGTRKALTRIGAELNAQFIVDGSIRRDGPRLRVTCALSRVSDHTQVWSAALDSEPAGLPVLARDLALSVTAALSNGASREQLPAGTERQSRDAEAYDAYLRGRHFWCQLTPITTRKAIEYYTRATAIDSNYALAWAGLTEAFASAPINGDADPRVLGPRAREAARRAIAANPHLSEAHTVAGQVQWFFEWDWPRAIDCHRRAIALDPSNAWSHSMLGHVLSQLGRHDEARPYMAQGCALEPMAAIHYAMASQVAFQAHEFETARQHANRAIVIDPEFWVGHMMLGQASEQLGDRTVALDTLTTASRLSGGNSKPVGLRGYILAKSGDTAAAREVLSMLDDLARMRYVPPFAQAVVHAGLGDERQVLEWLGRALDHRDVHLAFLTVDPKWDCFRSNSAFEALLARCAFDRRRQPSA